MADQIRPPINRKGCVARNRVSLHLEVEVTKNGITCCERVLGTLDTTWFSEFDGSAVDDGELEGKVSDQPPAEDGGDAGCEEDEVSESRRRKRTKPPTVDEYQWQWKVGHLAHALHRSALTRRHSPSLKLPDVHSFCSLYSLSLFFLCCPLPPRG